MWREFQKIHRHPVELVHEKSQYDFEQADALFNTTRAECLDCHSAGDNDVYYDNATDGGNGQFINIETEAHSDMVGNDTAYGGAWNSTYLAGNNEACISCHTNVTMAVWFNYGASTMNITATENVWGNWTVNYTASLP